MDERTIELVLKSVNIVDVISQYIPLKRAGGNYKARCPFHEEKTASFNVSESKQIFKCFGCGKGGNAITFVRDYEKISFFEALRKLAERVGIHIENERYEKKISTKRELIYTIYTLANDFYVENLKRHGAFARAYLAKRDIPPELATEFSLGYALNSFSGLKAHLQRNFITSDILLDTGLFRTNDKNDVYDLFRERLMFPIHAVSGQVVAFGGRALDPDNEKGFKYVNSPTTEIYQKGNELYGLHLTRFEIIKRDSVYICEGYLDFLRLYQKGFRNSVASLGTALTHEQINLLSRYTKNFMLLYDGDDAGLKAAVRAAGLITQSGCNPKIMLLPGGLDPDDFLQQNSSEALLQIPPQTLVEFVKEHNAMFGAERAAIQMLLDFSNDIADEIIRELYITDIAETFKLSEYSLRKNINTQRAITRTFGEQRRNSKKFDEERRLLIQLLKDPQQIAKVSQILDSDSFLNDDHRLIFNFLVGLQDIEDISQPALLIEKYKTYTVGDGSARPEPDDTTDIFSLLLFEEGLDEEIDSLVTQVRLRKLESDLLGINHLYAENPDRTELLEEKAYIKKEISKISKNIVRKTIS